MFPVKAPPRTARNTLRRAEDEQKAERKRRKTSTCRGDALGICGRRVAAAGAGVGILDAGAVLGVTGRRSGGLAAENENQYGFGMLARGLGKVGYSAFKAAGGEAAGGGTGPAEARGFEKRLRDVGARGDLRRRGLVESRRTCRAGGGPIVGVVGRHVLSY